MRTRLLLAVFPALAGLSFIGGGCAPEISADALVDKVDKPADVQFFGDRAVYLGDKDGYRYVHVRDMFQFWGFLGEGTYKVPDSQWPMQHPFPLTDDATQWQDVEWMNGDGPPGLAQNGFLALTPSFAEGAPGMAPAPTTNPILQQPAPATPATTEVAPTTQPTSQP